MIDRLTKLQKDPDHAFIHNSVLLTQTHLSIELRRAKQNYFVLINQQNHAIFPYLGDSQKNCGTFHGLSIPTPSSSNSRSFLVESSATTFSKEVALLSVEQLRGLEKNNISQKTINSVSPEDNPVIFIYNFKENL